MRLSLLVAFDKNRAIGGNNKLLWHIPDDLKRVKKLTTGNTIVMGQKTFESIGKALPNRKNVVLSDDPFYVAEGCIVAHSKDEVFEICKDDKEVFIFGGAMIYELFLDDVERMYITYVDHAFEGADTYFPTVNLTNWSLIFAEKGCQEGNPMLQYVYMILDRKVVC